MNRIPTIAAAIALIALLLAGYLALTSRIARLEEALSSAQADPRGADDFAALGYDGTGELRLRLSTRGHAGRAQMPVGDDAKSEPDAGDLPAAPEPTDAPSEAVAPEAPSTSEPSPTPDAAEAVAPEGGSQAPGTSAPEVIASGPEPATAPAQAPETRERGWFSQLLAYVGLSDDPTEEEIEAGIREALSMSADAALVRLGRPGGYADDPKLAIPLPKKLEAVRYVLKGVGMSTLMDDLRVRLNRAAELAAPDAREPLLRAIAELPLENPTNIQSTNDGATSYLRSRMSTRLTREVRPLIARRLEEVGAYDLYQQALGMYSALPFVPPIDGDLTSYATSRSLDGIFHCLKVEEQELRANPTRQTTVALQAFGATDD